MSLKEYISATTGIQQQILQQQVMQQLQLQQAVAAVQNLQKQLQESLNYCENHLDI